MEIETAKSTDNQIRKFSFYKQLKALHIDRKPAEFTASVIVIILLFVFAIKPTLNTITELKNKIDQLNTLDLQLKTKLGNLEELNKQYETIKRDLPIIDRALPDDDEFLILEKEVRFYVLRSGLTIDTINFSKFELIKNDEVSFETKNNRGVKKAAEETNSNLEVIKVSIKVNGNYDDVKILLNNIERNVRLSRIKRVDLIEDKDEIIGADIGFEVYYLVENLKN
jgi:Tfp pilus assembly protein PilO